MASLLLSPNAMRNVYAASCSLIACPACPEPVAGSLSKGCLLNWLLFAILYGNSMD